MSDFIEDRPPKLKRNGLFWIILATAGLVIYMLIGTDRDNSTVDKTITVSEKIDRNQPIQPGRHARQFIAQLRAAGPPYPLQLIFENANNYHDEGRLADAYLLYFFSAREGYVAAMMKMAEISDPEFFQAENSLLEYPDALQAYKWYQKAAEQGHADANERIQALRQWLLQESESSDTELQQLLLTIQ